MFKYFHPLSLDAMSKTLSDDGLKRRKAVFHYEWLIV